MTVKQGSTITITKKETIILTKIINETNFFINVKPCKSSLEMRIRIQIVKIGCQHVFFFYCWFL